MREIAPQSDTINKLQARLRTETRQKKAAIALLDNANLKYQLLLKSYM
ncbi:hypothetical protein IQ277_11640 [Nostocales cyanobacterium LEGE 12452]|nr:hypothetical protein [Nostocales cyanobacterium LEGE 12452]